LFIGFLRGRKKNEKRRINLKRNINKLRIKLFFDDLN